MQLKIINDDAINHKINCDLILTDPPFDLKGAELAKIVDKQNCNHLILITTMRQLIDFCKVSKWNISFDCVLNHVVPKKSKSIHQPNYIHSNCVYLTKNNVKSLFNRKLKERSDTYDGNGYWPTIITATRDKMKDFGYAKNIQALTDILGCFNIQTVADIFAGSGSTAKAAFELSLDCVLIEKEPVLCEKIRKEFTFLGINSL